MAKRDYYDLLGVPKNAEEAEIKRAYRIQARKFHPDVNPGNPEAVEKFKEISEAYQVIMDPQKRAAYDQFGHAGLSQQGFSYQDAQNGFGGFGDIFGDILSDFFGGSNRKAGPRRGADLRYDLTISFEEAVFGCEKTIELQRSESCTECKGSGAAAGSSRKVCKVCNGKGTITLAQGFFSIQRTCHQCQGEGEMIDKPCATCRGAGRVKRAEKLEVKIPPGVETGSKMKLSGEGEAGDRGGPAGSLYIVLKVGKHEVFERIGDDIICERNISFPLAALGGEVEVPTLKGKVKIKIPQATQTGKVFRLRGYGAKSLHGGQGDQLVKIFVRTPTKMSERQRELILELAKEDPELSGANLGGESSIFEKLKQALGG